MSLYLLILWPVICAFSIRYIPTVSRFEKNPSRIREIFALIGSTAQILLVAFLMTEDMTAGSPFFGGYGIILRFYGFNALFCLITAFAWTAAVIQSREYTSGIYSHDEGDAEESGGSCQSDNGRQYFYLFLTLGTLNGVLMAGDFFTLLTFFGISSFSIVMLTKSDADGSKTHSGIPALGLTLIFAGMVILYDQIGSLTFSTVYTFSGLVNRRFILIAGLLMLFGFAVRAGAYPMHGRLVKSSGRAPTGVSALLTGIITNSGLFCILNVTTIMLTGSETWADALSGIGMATMVWGAAAALLTTDLRKIFGLSAISRVGVIITGIGVFARSGSQFAIAGVIQSMINLALEMTVLYGVAGIIYKGTHSCGLPELRGYGHGKPMLSALCLSGMLGICGIPMWSGYVGNSLLHKAMSDTGSVIAEPLMIITGGLTMACMANVFITVFLRRPDKIYDDDRGYTDGISAMSMGLPALIMPAIGIMPNSLGAVVINYAITEYKLPELGFVYYFTGELLVGAFISLLVGVALYILLIKRMKRGITLPDRFSLDDMVYRPAAKVTARCSAAVGGVFDRAVDTLTKPFGRKRDEDELSEREIKAVGVLSTASAIICGLICIATIAVVIYALAMLI